jgi:hypothetical protein
MTRRTLLTVVATALVALAVSQVASAQTGYDFKIANSFVANGKTLPAGNYAFTVDPAGDVVTLAPTEAKGGSVALLIETRMAERKPLASPEVVFDKLDGQLYLSELLIPGADGYLLHATKAKHTHESLKGSPAKK